MHPDPLGDLDRPPAGAVGDLHRSAARPGRERPGTVGVHDRRAAVGRGVCDLAVGQVASGGDRGQVADRSGLDEWWGYRNSVDEAGWTSYPAFEAIAKARGIQLPQLWEATKGGPQPRSG